jgi:Spy/CpxP family protein refolding chaperone
LAAAAFSAALVFAQGPHPRGFGASGTPPDPATMIQMRVSYLVSLLGLSDAQKTQATTIFTNAYTAAQSILTSVQTDRGALAAAIKADSPATIDQLAASIGTLEGQLTAINAKADAAFYAILTAAQQATYDSMPHGGPGGPGGPGGHGFGPPPPR